MAHADSNGIVYLDDTDPADALHNTVNVVPSSVSAWIDTKTPIWRRADAGARAALATTYPPSLTAPLYVHQQDTGVLWRNVGSGWVQVFPAIPDTSGRILAAPTTTTANGTPTAGSTGFARDDVMGVYTCSVVAGRRYVAVYNNALMNGSLVGDAYDVTIRYVGGSGTPGGGDAIAAATRTYHAAAGGPGRTSMSMQGTIAPNFNGTATFAIVYNRVAGTGVGTPIAATGAARELYVVDAGPA